LFKFLALTSFLSCFSFLTRKSFYTAFPTTSFLLFVFISGLLCSLSVNASQIKPLPLDNSNRAVGEYFQVLAETDRALTIEQAETAFSRGDFVQWQKPVLSFGIGTSPRWLTAEVDNPGKSDILRRLVIENSWLDKLDIYVIENHQLVKAAHMGDSLTFSERPVKHRFFVFDYRYKPGITQLFIRVETPDPMVIPIFFETLEQAFEHDIFNSYSYGFLYGLIIALLLYNLILYLRLHFHRYLFYVIYLGFFLLMNLTYTGHGYYLIWPDSAFIQKWAHPFFISLFAFSGIIFAFEFLQTRKHFPVLFYRTIIFCLLFLFSQGLCFIYNVQYIAVASAIGFVIFYSVFTLYLAIINLRPQHREVTFFLIANIATLTGSVLTAMTVWGILPYHILLYRAVEIGIAIDVILLSIALAEQFRIIQEEKQSALKLAALDPLTGLYNRRAFYELVSPHLHNARRYQQNLSIIILDIDNFKMINDEFGHNTGDKVIQRTAEILQKHIRKGDISARWGGEEFIVLLPETELLKARQFAERIRDAISQQQFPLPDNSLSFTVSIGITELSSDMSSIEDLVKAADEQLYRAKSEGRNRVC